MTTLGHRTDDDNEVILSIIVDIKPETNLPYFLSSDNFWLTRNDREAKEERECCFLDDY